MISVLQARTINNVAMKKTLFITGIWLTVLTVSAQNKPVATHQSKAADKAKKIEALMQQYYAYDQFSGVWLVAENDRIFYKGAVGFADRTWNIPNRLDTKFGLASNVKQFVAALIMQLVEQGKIKLDGRLTDYLPEYPKEPGDRITVHHLLTHTSGIPNYSLFPDQWPIHYFNPYGQADYVKRFSEKKLDFEPGTQFNYSNSGYYLLGMMIERLTGKSFEAALADNILKPLGMTQSGCLRDEVIPGLATSYRTEAISYRPFKFDYTGDIATGDMYSTIDDIYKWQKALFSDGLLSATSRQLMFGHHASDTTHPFDKNVFFGYGFMTKKLPAGSPNEGLNIVYHTGGLGYTSLIMRLPDAKHSIILLSNIYNTRGNWINLYELFEAIINILYDKPYTLPKPTLMVALRSEIKAKGLQHAIARYAELKETTQKLKDEWDLNELGYYYLNQGHLSEAIEIFKRNITEFPKSGNIHDSLAEGYEKSGDKTLAIAYYEKALALDPKIPSSIAALKRLKKL